MASFDRALALAVPVAFVAASHVLWPDAPRRAENVYFCITLVGYGHLLGAAWFAPPVFPRPGGAPRALWTAFVWTSIAVVFGFYGAGVEAFGQAALASPLPVLGLLTVSNWHVLENELSQRSSGAIGGLPPIAANRRGHRIAVVGASGITFLAVSSPEVRAVYPDLAMPFVGPSFVDTFAVLTGYHVAVWLVFSVRRATARMRSGDAAGGRTAARRLFIAHAVPVAVGLALLAAGPRVEELRILVFGPAVYLFWSVLHVAQTALSRRKASPEPFLSHPARSPRSILHASNAHDYPLGEGSGPGDPSGSLSSHARLPAAQPRADAASRCLRISGGRHR